LERPVLRFRKISGYAILLTLLTLAPFMPYSPVPGVSADRPYSLSAVPSFTQEGNTVSLVLTVEPEAGAIGNTKYQFRFSVRDPAGTTFQSPLQNHTSIPGEQWFSIVLVYSSTSFPGSTSLFGQYATWVDQVAPLAVPNVAQSSFFISLANNNAYERTETVSIQGSGYNPSESVNVTIRTQITSTIVFSQTVQATPAGIVATTWKIPRNATIDNYELTLTGTSTVKNPLDIQTFLVSPATMSVSGITSLKSTYQRTETMKFSFQPVYPDGSIASTGVALLTLARPSGASLTLTATYDSVTQTFSANYKTSMDNQTGTWTATLAGHAYNDADGNSGPSTTTTNSPQLAPATLSINVSANTNVAVGQDIRFNATITYPDGTVLQSGSVGAYLLYSGTPTVNDTVPVIFDTGLGVWIGTYTARPTDPGGLWSLIVKGSDSTTTPNTGSATRAITLQNNAGGNVSFPLYYFGIIAALIAGLLAGSFLIFKKHKVTHARLKIDLEAVQSEARRVESQEFFKSIKDQVRKDKDD
jgi:hypothetical protein